MNGLHERPVRAQVARQPVPQSPPDALAAFVEPILADHAVVSWRLRLDSILAAASDRVDAHSARHAVARFNQWRRQWLAVFALPTLGDCEAVRARIQTQARPVLSSVSFTSAVLDPQDAWRLARELADAVASLDDTPSDGWALVDTQNKRTLRASLQRELRLSPTHLGLHAPDVHLTLAPGLGLHLDVGGLHGLLTGWQIAQDGLRVDLDSGTSMLSGPAATRLSFLAPGSVSVRVEPTSALVAAERVIAPLAEAATLAADTSHHLVIICPGR